MDSKYQIIRLDEESLEVITDLDPFYKGDMLSSSVAFGLGAIYETEDDLEIVGILLGTLMGKDVTIEWMAIDNLYQTKLIGGELLFEAFDLAVAAQAERVHVIIHDQYTRAKFCRGSDNYFKQHIFYQETAIGDDIITDLGTIYKSKFMKMPGVDVAPTALAKMNKKVRYDVLTELSKKSDAIAFFDLMSIQAGLDDDVSIVFYHKNKVVGAMLVYDTGTVIIPVYLWCKINEVCAPLIICCFKRAAAKYGRSKKVLITQRHPKTPAIAKKVLGRSLEAKLLTALVSDYKNLDTSPDMPAEAFDSDII